MKRFFITAILLIAPALYADDYSIRSINIYPTFVKVEFLSNINNNLDIVIPATFDIQSIRLNYALSENITSFNIKPKSDNFITPEYLADDEAKMITVQKEIDRLNIEIDAINTKSELLKNIKITSPEQKEIATFLDNIAKLQLTYATKIIELQHKLDKKKFILAVIKKNISDRTPKDFYKTYHINATANGKGKLYFEAISRDIKWNNIYELVLNSNSGNINISSILSIAQSTGINFKGDMTLHFDDQNLGDINTILPPEVLNLQNYNKPSAIMAPYNNKLRVQSEEMQADIDSMPTIQKQISGVVIKFKSDIISDGLKKEIKLANYQLKSKISTTLTPLLNKYAVISVQIDELTKPFLSGLAYLYIDTTLTSETVFRQIIEGKNINIPFGYSKLIFADRKEIINKDDAGVFKDNKITGYNIKISNLHNSQQNIILIDRIPISADSKLKVDKLNIIPKPKSVSDEGIITWDLMLDKNSVKDIEVRYELTYPNDMIIYQEQSIR